MARINNDSIYELDTIFTGEETLIGSDDDGNGTTKQYKLADLAVYFGAGGGGAVDSVFGRTGVVTAFASDYNGIYSQIGFGNTNNYLSTNNFQSAISSTQAIKLTGNGNTPEPGSIFIGYTGDNQFSFTKTNTAITLSLNNAALTNDRVLTAPDVSGTIALDGDYVDLVNNQLSIAGNKSFSNTVIGNGKVIVGGTEFGSTRIGDNVFRASAGDFNSISIKETGQPDNTALAIFTTKIGGSDGYVSSFKNFVDSVNVLSVAAANADQTSGTREVECTIGLRNDYNDSSFTVVDLFNQDYPSGTSAEIRQKGGIIAIHGGGAAAKEIGLWRYDTTTYTRIWEVDTSNNFEIARPTTINASLLSDSFALNALNTAPANAADTGTLGEIRIDANHIYVCTATDTWKRVAIATW